VYEGLQIDASAPACQRVACQFTLHSKQQGIGQHGQSGIGWDRECLSSQQGLRISDFRKAYPVFIGRLLNPTIVNNWVRVRFIAHVISVATQLVKGAPSATLQHECRDRTNPLYEHETLLSV